MAESFQDPEMDGTVRDCNGGTSYTNYSVIPLKSEFSTGWEQSLAEISATASGHLIASAGSSGFKPASCCGE